MKGFIEVAHKNRKMLVPVSEIKGVAETRKGKAAISLKEYGCSLFCLDGEVIVCEDDYETVYGKLESVTERL